MSDHEVQDGGEFDDELAISFQPSPISYGDALALAIAAAREADEAREGRDNRIGLIDPDTAARSALAWAAIAQAVTERERLGLEAGL